MTTPESRARDAAAHLAAVTAERDALRKQRDKLLRQLDYLTVAAEPFHGRADDCGRLARKILELKP